jgi:hypothetical protein
VRLNRGVTRGELHLTRIEQFKVLLQHEDVLGAIVSGERGGDCRFSCQPIFKRAASTRRAFVDGQLLKRPET